MRLLMVLVIFALLFFLGLTVGMIGSRSPVDEAEIEAIIEQYIENQDDEILQTNDIEQLPPTISEDKYIHTIASFLETIVVKIYDMIIIVLYKVAAIFFD